MKRQTLALALLLALVPASLLLAGTEGRLKGNVVDPEGKPILDAKITLSAQEVASTREAKSKKGGKFTMIVADASRSWTIRIEKEGYQTLQEPIRLTIGGQLVKTWTLRKGETVTSAATVEQGAPGAKAYNEGAKAFNNGDIDTALAKFQEAGQVNPELAQAFQGQAMIHWSRKETDLALAAAEKVVALDPTNVLGLRVRYDAYIEKQDERAPAALDALIGADPSPGTARRVFNAGVAAVKANETDAAIARFETAVGIDNTIGQGHLILGQLYNHKKEHDKAIASAETLLGLEPDNARAHGVLYEAYKAKGDQERADAAWAVLKQADPEDLARALYEEGEALFNAGNIPAATEKLEQAVDAYPELGAAHYTLGLCYLNVGNQSGAKEHLEKFIELAPENSEVAAAKDMLKYIQ